MQIERIGKALQIHFLLAILEGIVLPRRQFREAMQAILDRFRHPPDKDVWISDLGKTHVVELRRRQPRRRCRFEDCGAVPGAFESSADPDEIFRCLQPCYEYAIGTELQESFGPLKSGIEAFYAVRVGAASSFCSMISIATTQEAEAAPGCLRSLD